MRTLGRGVQHGLTGRQAQLLERHNGGLLRAASVLAAKNDMAAADIMFVMAERRGRIGGALGAALPLAAIGPVVLPGRAAELQAWIQRLAVHGPIWDCTGANEGIAIILIDQHDAMALCRLLFE